MASESNLGHGRNRRRRPIAALACAALAVAVSAVPAGADSTTTTTTATTTPCASPQFVVIPEDVTVTAGQSASFDAAFPGICFTPTAVIGTSEWEVSTDGGLTWSVVAGSAASILSTGTEGTSLTVPDTTVAMSGDEYRAVFSTSGGTTTTPAATLTVLPATTSTTTSTSTGTPSTTTSTTTASSTPTTTSTTTTTSSTTAPPSTGLPAVTGVTPSSGDSYSVVVIYGARFTHARLVAFGAKRTFFLTLRDSLIIAVAPSEAKGAVNVTVTTGAGTSPTSSADAFTYLN